MERLAHILLLHGRPTPEHETAAPVRRLPKYDIIVDENQCGQGSGVGMLLRTNSGQLKRISVVLSGTICGCMTNEYPR